MNLRLKLSRQFSNRWIFFLQPFPHRGRILFVRAAHRLLRSQPPGAQIASHRPHRNLQIEFSRQQLLQRFSGPQRKGEAELVWTTTDNVTHRRGCLMRCQARNRRPSATSCFQRPTSYALHQPHPAAHRTTSYPENPGCLGLRKTFLNGLDDSPAKVFLGFSGQRASILFFHAQTLPHYFVNVTYIMLRLVSRRDVCFERMVPAARISGSANKLSPCLEKNSVSPRKIDNP